MIKRCLFCGRFFRADPRVKNQKACFRERCKKARQQLSYSNWCKKNPNYFKGNYRYGYIKEWRAKKRKKGIIPKGQAIQGHMVSNQKIYRIVLLISKTQKKRLLKQEHIVFQKVCNDTFFGCRSRNITIIDDDTKRDTLNGANNDIGLQSMDSFRTGDTKRDTVANA